MCGVRTSWSGSGGFHRARIPLTYSSHAVSRGRNSARAPVSESATKQSRQIQHCASRERTSAASQPASYNPSRYSCTVSRAESVEKLRISTGRRCAAIWRTDGGPTAARSTGGCGCCTGCGRTSGSTTSQYLP